MCVHRAWTHRRNACKWRLGEGGGGLRLPSASSVRRRLQRTCPGPAAVPSAPVCARGLKTGGKGVSEREMLTDPLVFNTSNSALLRETVSLGWFFLHSPAIFPGLPGWLSGKESAHQCRRLGLDPWVRKIPWSRKWQTTPVFLPKEPCGQRSMVGCRLWGHRVRHD